MQNCGSKKFVTFDSEAENVLQVLLMILTLAATVLENFTVVLPFFILPHASRATTSNEFAPARLKLKIGFVDQIVSPGCRITPYENPGMPLTVLMFPRLSVTLMWPTAESHETFENG